MIQTHIFIYKSVSGNFVERLLMDKLMHLSSIKDKKAELCGINICTDSAFILAYKLTFLIIKDKNTEIYDR